MIAKNRKKILVSCLASAILVVTAVAYAQETHGHQPDTQHRGDPENNSAHADPGRGDPKGLDTHHAEDHADPHHGPQAINWTDLGDKHRPAFIALLVNFGLLLGLYYTMGKKPVVEGLKQRRVTIGKDIEEARKMLAEAQERAKKYQADLKNADTDAATAKATLVSAGQGEVERLVGDATERADRMSRDADRLIEQERKQLQQDLLVETIVRSVTEAEKLLQRTATAEDHTRLAEDLLAELAKMPGKGGSVPPRRPVGGAA